MHILLRLEAGASGGGDVTPGGEGEVILKVSAATDSILLMSGDFLLRVEQE